MRCPENTTYKAGHSGKSAHTFRLRVQLAHGAIPPRGGVWGGAQRTEVSVGRKDERLRMANGLAAGDRESRAQTPPVHNMWRTDGQREPGLHNITGMCTQARTRMSTRCHRSRVAPCLFVTACPTVLPPRRLEKEQRKEIDPQ